MGRLAAITKGLLVKLIDSHMSEGSRAWPGERSSPSSRGVIKHSSAKKKKVVLNKNIKTEGA